MKIYFSAAIADQKVSNGNIKKIVEAIKKLGHEVVSEHVFTEETRKSLESSEEKQQRHYKAMLSNISSCDMMIAEVSYPSTVHLGHELTLGLEKGKPVLALHQAGKRPVLFWGIDSNRFYLAEYNGQDIMAVLKDSIDYLADQQDVRFNFFISPRLQNYLEWVFKKRRVPRAVFLRRLIEEHMEGNGEYEG